MDCFCSFHFSQQMSVIVTMRKRFQLIVIYLSFIYLYEKTIRKYYLFIIIIVQDLFGGHHKVI